MNFGIKTIVWYDRELRLWTAVRKDPNDNQVGYAGYGVTKKEAILDVNSQYDYSNDLDLADF